MNNRLSQKDLEATEIPIEDELEEPFHQDNINFGIKTKKSQQN